MHSKPSTLTPLSDWVRNNRASERALTLTWSQSRNWRERKRERGRRKRKEITSQSNALISSIVTCGLWFLLLNTKQDTQREQTTLWREFLAKRASLAARSCFDSSGSNGSDSDSDSDGDSNNNNNNN